MEVKTFLMSILALATSKAISCGDPLTLNQALVFKKVKDNFVF